MRRREFLTILSGAAMAPLVWPDDALAQQPRNSPTIGFLGTTTPTIWSANVAAFQNRLRELGWIEGRTVAIEYRWADGRGERYAEIAAEFIHLKVDVIVTPGGAVVTAEYGSPVELAVRIDVRVLHCPLCARPFKPPVLQVSSVRFFRGRRRLRADLFCRCQLRLV